MQSREEPLQLKLDTCKSVFFKPTWVGCSSTSLFTFHNPLRLPLEFEWRISQQHRKMLAVQPARGLIQPSDSLVSPAPLLGAHAPLRLLPGPQPRHGLGEVYVSLGGLCARRSQGISHSCLSRAGLTVCTFPVNL